MNSKSKFDVPGEGDSWEALAGDLFGIDFSKDRTIPESDVPAASTPVVPGSVSTPEPAAVEPDVATGADLNVPSPEAAAGSKESPATDLDEELISADIEWAEGDETDDEPAALAASDSPTSADSYWDPLESWVWDEGESSRSSQTGDRDRGPRRDRGPDRRHGSDRDRGPERSRGGDKGRSGGDRDRGRDRVDRERKPAPRAEEQRKATAPPAAKIPSPYAAEEDFGAGILEDVPVAKTPSGAEPAVVEETTWETTEAFELPEAEGIEATAAQLSTDEAEEEFREGGDERPQKKRRRRRRRRKPGGDRPEQSSGDAETEIGFEAAEDVEDDEESVDAAVAAEGGEEPESKESGSDEVRGRRRRRRRPRRRRDSADEPRTPATDAEEFGAAADEDDEDDEDEETGEQEVGGVDLSEDAELSDDDALAEDDDDDDVTVPHVYRNVPTWEEAISILLKSTPGGPRGRSGESTGRAGSAPSSHRDDPKSSGRRRRRRK